MTKSGDSAARRRLTLLACLWLALPAALGAQDPLGTPLEGRRGEQDRAELRLRAEEMRLRAEEMRGRAGELRTRVHALVQGRARLGVLLGEAMEVGGRTGVHVNEVVEGGPAARAGIRASDVLLALDGQTLGPDPARHLVELMAEVEPGDTVSVLVHREGRDHTIRVVTDRSSPMTIRFGERGVPGVLRPGFDPGPALREALGERGLRMVGPAGRHRLELVEMNPGLGRYFGATEGVLVVNVGADSSLGLQPGDVLLSIGGRPVRDATHVRSILGSYRADEDVELEVVRDGRTITVRGRTGAGGRP